eukprot:2428969-Rhodomonas_salina.1
MEGSGERGREEGMLSLRCAGPGAAAGSRASAHKGGRGERKGGEEEAGGREVLTGGREQVGRLLTGGREQVGRQRC